MANETDAKSKNGKKIRAYLILAITVAVLLYFGYNWYRDYNSYEQTDDAYIDADRVSVSSKMMGRIAKVYAVEGDDVTAGKLLVELDSTDLAAQRQQAEAAVIQAETAATQSLARLRLDEKNLKVQQVNLEKAKEDYDRASRQLEGNVITREQYDHIKKSYEVALAQLDVMAAQLDVSKTSISNSEQLIKSAESQLNTISTQLRNSRIYAPSNGKIAK